MKNIFVEFQGYHENLKKTDLSWDIISFDNDEQITKKKIEDALSDNFSGFRRNKEIYISRIIPI